MNTIEQLQDKPYGEICTRLAEIAPQVLAAKAKYDELVAEQRVYIGARELISADMRLGDRVRVHVRHHKHQNKIAVVTGADTEGLLFQRVKDGKLVGPEIFEWMLEGYEKL